MQIFRLPRQSSGAQQPRRLRGSRGWALASRGWTRWGPESFPALGVGVSESSMETHRKAGFSNHLWEERCRHSSFCCVHTGPSPCLLWLPAQAMRAQPVAFHVLCPCPCALPGLGQGTSALTHPTPGSSLPHPW